MATPLIALYIVEDKSISSTKHQTEPSIARNAYDCELLRVAKEIESGSAPNFRSLRSKSMQSSETMILRAFDEFWNQGGIPEEKVLNAYNIIQSEMARQQRERAILFLD